MNSKYLKNSLLSICIFLAGFVYANSRQGVLVDSSWVLTYHVNDQPSKVWINGEERALDALEYDGPLQLLHLTDPIINAATVPRARLADNSIFDQIIKIYEQGSAEGAPEVQVGGNKSDIKSAELAGEGLYALVEGKPELFGLRSEKMGEPIPLSQESNTWIDNTIIRYALKAPVEVKKIEKNSVDFLYDAVACFAVREADIKGVLIDSSWVLVSENQWVKQGTFLQIGIKPGKLTYATVDLTEKVVDRPFLMCHLNKPVTNIIPVQRARRGETLSSENIYIFGGRYGAPLISLGFPPYKFKGGEVFTKSGSTYLLDGLVNLDENNAIPLDLKTNTAIDNIIIAAALGKLVTKPVAVSQSATTTQPIQGVPIEENKIKWNVLVYANDQDFEGSKAFIGLVNSIVDAAESKDIKILVQHTAYGHYNFQTEKMEPYSKEDTKSDAIDDFVGTKRFIIQGNGEGILAHYGFEAWATKARSRIKEINLQGEIDPGKESTFRDFLIWGMSHPAKRTILSIWAHGMGWRWISNGENNLKTYQFGNALQQGLGKKIELIRLDSCRSQMAELLYQIRENAEYVMGSEDTTPLDFMTPSYNQMITVLAANMDKSSKVVSEKIWENYKQTMDHLTTEQEAWYVSAQGWNPADGYTISLVDDLKVAGLKQHIDELATLLIQSIDQNTIAVNELQQVRKEVQKYGTTTDYFVDLWDLADQISKIVNVPLGVAQKCNQLKDFITTGFVLKNHYLKDKLKNTHGVSIDFSPAGAIQKTDYKDLEFAKNGTWYDLLLRIP